MKKSRSFVLLAKRIKFRNNMEYYLVTKISNGFSTINVSEFNEVLVGFFAVIVVFLDIHLRNNFQNIIRSFKSFYIFVGYKESWEVNQRDNSCYRELVLLAELFVGLLVFFCCISRKLTT
jgi:hypothetical protein